MFKLLLAALLPIVLFLVIIYKIDRYDPEPKKLLTKLFVFGILIAIPVIIVEGILGYLNIFALTGTDLTNVYTAFVVAALTEEVFKWMVVMKYAYKNRAYNEHLDGIVYCVFVSLGFAALENVGYVLGNNDINIAFIRAITALPGHLLFGVVMGYFFSMKKFALTKSAYKRASRMALIAPIIVHGIYDYILMSHYKWLLIGFIPFMIWLWVYGIRKIKIYYEASKAAHVGEA